MDAPLLHEFKRQASFFLREKIKTARLALTDVTPTEILTEEATNGDLGAANVQAMRLIARAAFEVDDYWRIVDILHKRLMKFSKRNWRESYKALTLLEYLLTHGPESVADEFQSDEQVITEMISFQYVDEKGFNWGSSVQKKSERVIRLLEDRSYLKEERTRERKVTNGINGFGSFCKNSVSEEETMKDATSQRYLRCNSHFCKNLISEEESTKDATSERYLRCNSHFCKNSVSEEGDMENKTMFLNKQSRSHGEYHKTADENDQNGWGLTSARDHHPFFEKGSHSRLSLLSSTT
ncbi:PREDICTED: ENTH domain-containing protein C794.11c-like [Ipomoea nil]|uniref:ENTH domain-containing protein C794.11c-like n=1 Tax=Ipomoea nil TaxID=35883 RepID=UPI000901013A|nr:PREDICTED: ENTH domain-containing protein C794.11c-like [Ipomoea nil]